MLNKFLLIAFLPTLFLIGLDADVNCKADNGTCTGTYCMYVSYSMLKDGTKVGDPIVIEGCTSSYVLNITGALWTFPINHCQKFTTNETTLPNNMYIYGNVCNSRDNCTYQANGDGSLVCAGLRTSPILGLTLLAFGILIAKIFV